MSPARSIRLSTVTALAILVSAGASAASPHPPSEVRNAQEIQKVVADLCDAKLVFLGEEGSHGGAVALQVKAEIIEDLVTKCHFNHVAFESQLYDFEDLKQRYRSGTATEAALSNAVGGLWSTTTEIQPLLRLLHKKAVAGDVILSGIDGQIGGATGIYTQKQLGAEIAQVLIEPRRSACRANIDRLTSWQFDDDHPYGAAFKSDLNACLDDARMAAAGVKPANARVGLFATSLQSYVKFTDDDSFNQRDRLMYENLTSVLRSLPKQTKTVVWTANVHAPRVPHDGTKPTASYFDPQDRKSIKGIGIVGASGTYGRQGRKPTALEPASADSLEGMALAGGDAESNYLSARQLLAYDKLPSRLLGYGRYQSAEWSHLFDGVLVLKSERPPDFTRPPKPLPEASR